MKKLTKKEALILYLEGLIPAIKKMKSKDIRKNIAVIIESIISITK